MGGGTGSFPGFVGACPDAVLSLVLSRDRSAQVRARTIAPGSSELDAFRDRGDEALGAQSVIADLQPRHRSFILSNLLFAEERELEIDRLRLEVCRGRLLDLLSTLVQSSRVFPVSPLMQATEALLARIRELQAAHTANQGAIEEARAAQSSIEEFIGLPGLSTPPTGIRGDLDGPVAAYIDDSLL